MQNDDRIARANVAMWQRSAKRWHSMVRAVNNAGGNVHWPAAKAIQIACEADPALRRVSHRTLERDWEALRFIIEHLREHPELLSPAEN